MVLEQRYDKLVHLSLRWKVYLNGGNSLTALKCLCGPGQTCRLARLHSV